MSTTTKATHAKLFLEGIEVPFRSARISGSYGVSAPTCELQLPPHSLLADIETRTLVHLFARLKPSQDERYLCVFEGEVAGRGLSRQAESGSRAFVLHAEGLSNYWRFSRLYYTEDGAASPNLTAGASATEQVDGSFETAAGLSRLDSLNRRENQTDVLVNSSILEYFRGNTFGEGIERLMKEVFRQEDKDKKYQFLVDADDRLRLVDRVLAETGNVVELMQEDRFSFFVSQLLLGRGGSQTLATMLSTILDASFHQATCLPAPVPDEDEAIAEKRRAAVRRLISSPDGDEEALAELQAAKSLPSSDTPGMASYIFHPDLYFSAPPSCNVFFPDMLTYEGYSENLMDAPTRAHFLGPPIATNLTRGSGAAEQTYTQPRVAPSSRFRNEVLYTGRDGKITEGGTPVGKNLGEILDNEEFWGNEQTFLTEQELKNGANPIEIGWPALATLLMEEQQREGGEQGARDVEDDRWQRMADYLYWQHYFSVARSLPLSNGPFNPFVVPGLPGIALDDSEVGFHVVGHVDSYEHVIDSEGDWSTTVMMSMCRYIGEDGPTFTPDGSALPPWLEADTYSDLNIGRMFYQQLLGTNSIADYGDGDVAAGAAALVESRRKILDSGEGAIDAFEFGVVSRRLATEEEMMAFLSANPDGSGRYAGAVWNSERRSVVEEYVAEMSTGRAFR